MSLAESAQGSLLKLGDGASPEVFSTIPEVMKLTAPDISFDLIDVTSHDSAGGFREFLPGLAAGNNASFDFNFVPANTVHQGIRDENLNKTKSNYKLVFAGAGTGDTLVFAAYMMGFAPTASVGDAKRATGNMRMSGQPTWS